MTWDCNEVHIRIGYIQETEIVSEPIYKKGKVMYIYAIIERKNKQTN